MKKLMIILGLTGLFACKTEHSMRFNINKLQGSFNDINVKNDTFYYIKKPIAAYSNMELECLEKNCVVEISVVQFSSGFNDTTQMLMKYLHYQHPHSKIEVKVK